MNQSSKTVKGEYIFSATPFPEKIEIEWQGDYLVVTDRIKNIILLQCSPNTSPLDSRQLSRACYKVKIEIEAINHV